MEYQTLTSIDTATTLQKNEIADFLYVHLDEFGDEKEDILKCLDYALSSFGHQGGFVVLARENGAIKGAVVVNQTGMAGYIPENILVYIAVHSDQRGKGVGKELMKKAINTAKEYYKSALLSDPYNNEARYNYELLAKFLDFPNVVFKEVEQLVKNGKFKEAYELLNPWVSKDYRFEDKKEYNNRLENIVRIEESFN